MATILVLEDDYDLRNLYTRALTFRGYQAVAIENAKKAIELLACQSIQPDVVVLDMSMPGLPGSAVVEFIRSDYPRPNLPIIIISCDETFKHLLQWAKIKFLPKPINLADLYTAIGKTLC
jgi:DNA-binding NtrC family response regulator